MELIVAPGAEPTLADPEKFDAFKVTLRGAADPAAADAALAALGERVDDDHVAVAPDTVRRLAGPAAADPAWEPGFAAMVAYADSKGWLIDGAIRAHVERVDP
jgi:hypothetical protein